MLDKLPKRYIFLVALLIVGVGVVLGMLQNPDYQQEQSLNAYLRQNEASAQEKDAYFFAMRHPEVLKVIPCYCGCSRQGHKSNYNCFMADNPAVASEPWDGHGLVCPMCVDIALKAKMLTATGTPVKEVRHQVDDMFKQYPHLHPTPTPKPGEKVQKHAHPKND